MDAGNVPAKLQINFTITILLRIKPTSLLKLYLYPEMIPLKITNEESSTPAFG